MAAGQVPGSRGQKLRQGTWGRRPKGRRHTQRRHPDPRARTSCPVPSPWRAGLWSPTATSRPGRPSRWVSPGRAPDLRTPRSSNRPWALTSGHGLLALSPVGTAEACGAAWGGGRVPTAGNRQRGGGGWRPGGRGRVSATGTKRPSSHLEVVRGSKSVCVCGGGRWTQPPSTPATDGG